MISCTVATMMIHSEEAEEEDDLDENELDGDKEVLVSISSRICDGEGTIVEDDDELDEEDDERGGSIIVALSGVIG